MRVLSSPRVASWRANLTVSLSTVGTQRQGRSTCQRSAYQCSASHDVTYQTCSNSTPKPSALSRGVLSLCTTQRTS